MKQSEKLKIGTILSAYSKKRFIKSQDVHARSVEKCM